VLGHKQAREARIAEFLTGRDGGHVDHHLSNGPGAEQRRLERQPALGTGERAPHAGTRPSIARWPRTHSPQRPRSSVAAICRQGCDASPMHAIPMRAHMPEPHPPLSFLGRALVGVRFKVLVENKSEQLAETEHRVLSKAVACGAPDAWRARWGASLGLAVAVVQARGLGLLLLL
jgi:hypothetical protein